MGVMSFVTAWASRVFRKDSVFMVFWERGPSCVGGALWGSVGRFHDLVVAREIFPICQSIESFLKNVDIRRK